MALVSLKCPSCGGNIQMDDAKEKGFCMYCGSNFLVKDEIQRIQIKHSGSVNFNVNRNAEVTNLLIRAEDRANALLSNKSISTTDFYQGCLEINERYTEKILDIDARNQRAIELRKKLANENNRRVEYECKCIAEKKEKNIRLYNYTISILITILIMLLVTRFISSIIDFILVDVMGYESIIIFLLILLISDIMTACLLYFVTYKIVKWIHK